MGLALVAISAPVYWLGLVALYLFSKDIGQIPDLFKGAGTYVPFSTGPVALVRVADHAVVRARGRVRRLLRAARARQHDRGDVRGLHPHGAREGAARAARDLPPRAASAITPVVTAAGLDIGILLGGTILVETVFNIPGVGRLAYDSIQNADLPMIQGTVLLGAFFIIMANLVVDMLYAFLDPRVRY